MITGDDYIRAMSVNAADRRARDAFRNAALAAVAPPAKIFDFGCGPGLDAKFYASKGYAVSAYDSDPAMCAAFCSSCKQEIGEGNVSLFQGDYEQFLGKRVLPHDHRANLVTANFAPFSLIDDLQALFVLLYAATEPAAKILISVLNPYFIGDMRFGWWWRHKLEFWRNGQYYVPGTGAKVHRRSPRIIAAAAAPHFRVLNVMRGLPRPVGASESSGLLGLRTSQYIFMTFIRCSP